MSTAADQPLQPGRTIRLEHVASGYTLPPTFQVGSHEDNGDLTFQVKQLPEDEAPHSLTHHRRGVHHGAKQHHGTEPAVDASKPHFLRALPRGPADFLGGTESEEDRRAERFVPTYHEAGSTPVVSLRGRLLIDEHERADNSSRGTEAVDTSKGASGVDPGYYLGVKGAQHTLVSNVGLGPDSRFRVHFADAGSGPTVGGRLKHDAEQAGAG